MNVFEFLITLTKRCTQCNEWGGGQWRGRGGQRPLIRATRRLTQHLWHHQQAHYLLLGDLHNTLCFCIVYLYIFKSYNCPNLNSDQYYEEKHVQHVQSWGWGCILRLSERSRSHWGGVKALSLPIHHQGHLSSGLCFLANLLRILQIEGGSAKGEGSNGASESWWSRACIDTRKAAAITLIVSNACNVSNACWA